jgi:hypothetical protein
MVTLSSFCTDAPMLKATGRLEPARSRVVIAPFSLPHGQSLAAVVTAHEAEYRQATSGFQTLQNTMVPHPACGPCALLEIAFDVSPGRRARQFHFYLLPPDDAGSGIQLTLTCDDRRAEGQRNGFLEIFRSVSLAP